MVKDAPRNLWLISPYDSGSHAVWAQGYMAHTHHDVTLLRMAGRFWKWRMQGGAIELAAQARSLIAKNGPPDAILATDMLNLPSFLGLLQGELPAHIPVVLYMHENQITYPWREGEKRDLTYGMINWLSQLAADHVWFNSHYHLDSWFDELPRLLKHYPDYCHLELTDEVRARSSVLPVGIDCATFLPPTELVLAPRESSPPLILWNQRWEYDKRPDRFFTLLDRLQACGLPFRLAIAGENYRNVPQEFNDARVRLKDRIEHWGYVDSRAAYADLLRKADLVISTADHEFFGISVLEAVSAGAFPLLPDRLSYPELIPDTCHADCLYSDSEDLFEKTKKLLTEPRSLPTAVREHVVTHFDWPTVASRYDELLDRRASQDC